MELLILICLLWVLRSIAHALHLLMYQRWLLHKMAENLMGQQRLLEQTKEEPPPLLPILKRPDSS
jgi:hypothetical protein